jgi:hypothetical protein
MVAPSSQYLVLGIGLFIKLEAEVVGMYGSIARKVK